jgi:hypothetical protein
MGRPWTTSANAPWEETMHILTGMLLAGLLGRKGKGPKLNQASDVKSSLLRAPSVLSVTHALPGRTRFRVPALVGRAEAAGKLGRTLAGIQGIRRAEASAVSGSVLVEHDAERVAPDVLAAALIRLCGLEEQITGDVEAGLARELRDFSRAFNRAVYEKTGGLLDMKTALFLALAALGTMKLLQQRSLAWPAGFTLLWWAGNGLFQGDQISP